METNGNGTYFADVYAKLAAPFDNTFKDVRGGVELEYITGEQCITRLNETLGVAGWSFTIKEHGINAEADECWVLAELSANFGGTIVLRQQFGSQKVKRSRSSGTPLDIGFDLSKKEQPFGNGNGSAPLPRTAADGGFGTPEVGDDGELTCADCGK